MTYAFNDLLGRAAQGHELSPPEITAAFAQLLEGQIDPVQAGGFLMALKVRGETPAEIAAAATAMRSAAVTFQGPEGAVDTCGTGGDGANTYNISTATAIVLAACGVPVAKHGNKAVSSASGSSDVLTALGVDVTIGPERAKECLEAIGIAFLFAPHHHPAVRHVAPVRAALGVRTLFNLLGPLTNPARARRQVLGVYDRDLTRPIAHTLQVLGATDAWVVHGSDGLDELTITGPSYVSMLSGGQIVDHTVTPEDAGLSSHASADLVGGDSTVNAAAIRDMFAGGLPAYRDATILNCAAGLIVAGKAASLRDGAQAAARALSSGAATEKLDDLIRFTTSVQ